ncbi:MAG: DNA helicase II [Candidatus Heimdallarchaeota archaeon LC_3]|nr:MAG: DNA helicase II [Candidatus Heimdallarchaeota archaeon LC_3]
MAHNQIPPAQIIDEQEFLDILAIVLDKDFRIHDDNPNINVSQRETLIDPLQQIQFIVAGPGSGKTTVLVLRVLYLIFVCGNSPNSILITTFTKKTAEELRSRIQGWGLQLVEHLNQNGFEIDIDYPSIIVGTLDSILQEMLTQAQASQGLLGTLLDSQGVRVLLTRIYSSLPQQDRQQIGFYLLTLENDTWEEAESQSRNYRFANSFAQQINRLLTLSDRLIADFVDITAWQPELPELQEAHNLTIAVIQQFWNQMHQRNLYSFSTLALYFAYLIHVDSIPQSILDSVYSSEQLGVDVNVQLLLENLAHLLIDEYQDTNFLQEQIYFQIFRIIRQTDASASISVVGDDDQSLYRFRGSTVELFTQFPDRLVHQIDGVFPEEIQIRFLTNNYRSTAGIIDFYNRFLTLFPQFEQFRVEDKPATIFANLEGRPYNPPLIFITAENSQQLAREIARFVHQVSAEPGLVIDDPNDPYLCPNRGDIAIIANSIQESMGQNIKFLGHLRQAMSEYNYSIFNPQGRSYNDIPSARNLLGLTLLMIDPDSTIQDRLRVDQDSLDRLQQWRNEARAILQDTHEEDAHLHENIADLRLYVEAWHQKRKVNWTHNQLVENWREGRSTMSISRILYDLLRWFPYFTNDKEGIVYFSSMVNLLNQLSIIGGWGEKLVNDTADPTKWQVSVRSAIVSFFIPLASGSINVDETLLETAPRDRMVARTIWTAKGLEFPITIIDIGSEITMNHKSWRPRYFPIHGIANIWLTRRLRPYSPMDPIVEDPIDSSFADVIRKFFVAYSRAESLLVLACTSRVLGHLVDSEPNSRIQAVQVGSPNQHTDNRPILFPPNSYWRYR